MEELEDIRKKVGRLIIPNKEKLVHELRDLMCLYCDKYFEPNKTFIFDLSNLIIELEGLQQFIKNIEVIDKFIPNSDSFGSLNLDDFAIKIYVKNIINDYRQFISNLDFNLQKIFLFCRVFVTCFHEFEHIHQLKLCLENKYHIETLILRDSMNYLNELDLKNKLLHKGYNKSDLLKIISRQQYLEYGSDEFYDINPSERLADIKSYYVALNIFSEFFPNYPFLKRDLFYCFYDFLLQGYDDYKNPTKSFINLYDTNNNWKKIEKLSSSLTTIEKAAYGIGLERREKQMLKNKRGYYYRGY